ncbi:hypothetical protein BC940DRAFT_349086 [Gongronella butleri]|nr:hypothetical protein BC940DRAFT_349086 [Gongronella butleri]
MIATDMLMGWDSANKNRWLSGLEVERATATNGQWGTEQALTPYQCPLDKNEPRSLDFVLSSENKDSMDGMDDATRVMQPADGTRDVKMRASVYEPLPDTLFEGKPLFDVDLFQLEVKDKANDDSDDTSIKGSNSSSSSSSLSSLSTPTTSLDDPGRELVPDHDDDDKSGAEDIAAGIHSINSDTQACRNVMSLSRLSLSTASLPTPKPDAHSGQSAASKTKKPKGPSWLTNLFDKKKSKKQKKQPSSPSSSSSSSSTTTNTTATHTSTTASNFSYTQANRTDDQKKKKSWPVGSSKKASKVSSPPAAVTTSSSLSSLPSSRRSSPPPVVIPRSLSDPAVPAADRKLASFRTIASLGRRQPGLTKAARALSDTSLTLSVDYSREPRLPPNLERAIYRLSHFKLLHAHQRPLREQVSISNFMFWYLEAIQGKPARRVANYAATAPPNDAMPPVEIYPLVSRRQLRSRAHKQSLLGKSHHF